MRTPTTALPLFKFISVTLSLLLFTKKDITVEFVPAGLFESERLILIEKLPTAESVTVKFTNADTLSVMLTLIGNVTEFVNVELNVNQL